MSFVSKATHQFSKVLLIGAALIVQPMAACSSETDGVSDNTGALKGGIPNSPNGKGRGKGAAAGRNSEPVAGGEAPDAADAGVTDEKGKGKGKKGQAAAADAGVTDEKVKGKGKKGQAAAAGAEAQPTDSTEKGKGKAKSDEAKTKGMGMGSKGGEDEAEAEDEDDSNDESDSEDQSTTP